MIYFTSDFHFGEERLNLFGRDRLSLNTEEINTLIIKKDASRGRYPIGVSFRKNVCKFTSSLSVNGKRKFLGYFSTHIKAFNAYKIAKEKHIKIMANKYKDVLNANVYASLMNYEVLITD